MAYDQIDPFGEFRADMRAARICEVIAAVNRDPKSGRIPKVSDFLLFPTGIAESRREATREEIRAYFGAVNEAQKAVESQGKRP